MILLHNLKICAHPLDTCPWYGNKIKYFNKFGIYNSFQGITNIYKYAEDIHKDWVTELVPIKSRLVNRMPHI